MKKKIIVLGIVGLLIGCFLSIFSILWELSEIRGACQDCPIDFWKNTTSLDIINIAKMGIIGSLIGGSIGFIIHKLTKNNVL